MVFASAVFLYYFLPVFLAVYYLARQRTLRLLWITLASYVFYGWWRPDFVTLMWVSTFVDYACGQGIVRARARGLQQARGSVSVTRSWTCKPRSIARCRR